MLSCSWSFGVLLYELFSYGDVPYAMIDQPAMLDYVNSGQRLPQPEFAGDEMWEFRSNFSNNATFLIILSSIADSPKIITHLGFILLVTSSIYF